MSFKKFLRYATAALVIGAILILGFLAFSGIYVLAPILGLCIAAFILSVVFEGEIYYQNISKAIKSLIKPHYIESKLAEECLQEAIQDINDQYELINAIDEFLQEMDANAPIVDPEAFKKKYQKICTLRLACKNKKSQNQLPNIPNIQDIDAFISKNNQQHEPCEQELITPICIPIDPAKINIKKQLTQLKTSVVSHTPQFLIDYAQIATIDHSFAHINPNEEAQKHKQALQVALSIMEQIFTEQLFPHTQANNTPGKTWWGFGGKKPQATESSNAEASLSNEESYKKQLREYLAKIYGDKYNAMLPKRKFGSRFIKVLSTVCAGLMILGTSYLLVEAFAVVPLLAAIPFGALPAVIVPLAVLAGIAYGLQTYQALDEILNSDIITQRIAKIKADIKAGLNLYTGAKLAIFLAFLGLAITLTICTGGTWYTILKHTQPLFSWLSKIPTVVIGVIAGFLAVASFAFNISNSAQTAEELEEAFESQVPEDNPYNIDLLELAESDDVETDIKYVSERIAIIKQGTKYYIHCCPRDGNEWQRIEVQKSSFLLRTLLNRVNFKQNILYYSVFNSVLYILIRNETNIKFNPSKENWTQFFNPARIFLLVTYLPIRIVFFLGHLASISATADRIPGIPDIISMMIGFVAELFEDLHYFTSFNHAHKTDLPAIVTEHFKEDGNCDHANDLPTRVLRDYLFYPVFMAAAWWHSRYSGQESTIVTFALKAVNWLRSIYSKKAASVEEPIQNAQASKTNISYEDALEQMRGKQPKSDPKSQLNKNSQDLLDEIENHLKQEESNNSTIIDSQEDLITLPKSGDRLIAGLFTANPVSTLGIFATRPSCGCHSSSGNRNMLMTL